MNRPIADNALLQSAEFSQVDRLVKKVLLVAFLGVTIGVFWYILVGIRAGA
jgi:hypothetical protein